MGAAQNYAVGETGAESSIVVRLENVSDDRTRPTNVYEACVQLPGRAVVTRVACQSWDSQKPITLRHGYRRVKQATYEFARTYEASSPFAGRPLSGTWRAERRTLRPNGPHPDHLLITIHYRNA